MAPPKDIARSYPKRGITADVGFRSDPKFCGDGSIQLNGSNQYLNAELSSALGDSFTIMGWAKREDTSPTLDYIVNAGNPGGAGNAISISITNADPGILYFFDNSTSVNTSNTVDFNEWFHFALTVAPGAGNVKLYKNGIDGTPSNSVAVNLSDVTFELGRYLNNNHYFPGKLFDVRVYDETLTQDQIRELLNNPGQTVPTGLTSADLIHRYLLETDTNDTGATGNNLTANNSPTFGVDRAQLPRGLDLVRGAAQARCFTGRAVEFDGSADYLRADSSLNNGADFSHSLWVYLDSNSGTRTILNDNTLGCYIYLSKIGVWNIWGSFPSGQYVEKQSTANASTGRWFHLAFTYTHSGTSLKLYIDGIDQPTVPSPVIGAGTDPNYITIGGRNNSGSPTQFLDGQIAGVKRFNVALTQAQVQELYHNPEQVLPTGVSASSMTRYYPLSDYNDTGGTGGRYFQDMGTDGEPAEDKGSSSMEFGQLVPCPQLGLQQSATRLLFPGGSTTHNAVATTAALGTTASVSCWFQSKDLSATQIIWSIGNAAGTGFLEAYINSSGSIVIFGQANITVAAATEGAWTHLVVTTDSGSPPYKAYLNGAAISLSGSDTARNFTNGSFEIGNQDVAFSPYAFNGIINDIACWNTELSLSDAQSLYNSGVMGMDVGTVQASNLKGWWKCDDFETFKDYSGNGANATVTNTFNAASFPENASGSTLVGDFSMKRKGVSVLNLGAVATGANEYALSSKDSAFLPSFANGGSFSCFFRVQKLGEYSTIFINDDYGSGVQHRFAVYVTNANKLQLELGDGASARANPITTATISDSEWHHFAFTVGYGGGSTTTIKLFLDGALESTSTATTLAGVPNATQLRFGDYVTTGSNEANGPIACLKFYQVTLSDNEIKQIYNSDLRLIKGLANE